MPEKEPERTQPNADQTHSRRRGAGTRACCAGHSCPASSGLCQHGSSMERCGAATKPAPLYRSRRSAAFFIAGSSVANSCRFPTSRRISTIRGEMIAVPHRVIDWLYLTAAVIFAAKMAGPVLLDCSGHTRRGAQLLYAVLMLLIGCVGLLYLPRGRFQGLFWIAWSAIMLLTVLPQSEKRSRKAKGWTTLSM